MRIQTTIWVSAMLLVALVVGLSQPAYAQVLYGSIIGTITDETGAVVPGASVSVMNTATGASQEVTTNEVGIYRITNVFAGNYDLTVTSEGFRPFTAEGVTVAVNNITRQDVQMQLGQVVHSAVHPVS